MRLRHLFFAAALLTASPANAAYVIQASEINGSVVFTGNGTLNLAALSSLTVIAPNPSYVFPLAGNLTLGTPEASEIFLGSSGPLSFGTGPFLTATSTSGSQVGMGPTSIRVPFSYVSGSALGTSVSTFENSTFATLGLVTGNYVWNWGQGATSDSLTLQIGSNAPAVPEPAAWATMLLGFGLIGAAMRRRGRQKVSVRFG